MGKVSIKKWALIIVSVLNVLLLSIGHVYNNQVLMWCALAVFSASAIFSQKGDFLPIMLFYLPWSPVLKTVPNTFTFASLIIPVVIFVALFDKEQEYKTTMHLGTALFLITYTLFVKLLNGLTIQTPYLFFIMMLFWIPIYINKYKEDIRFERCVLFLVAGILSACIGADILMNYPHMLLYIELDKSEQIGLTRLSGFNGDPNYYSAQILVTIASLLIVLSKTRRKALIILQIVSIVALLYFGLQSVSKMFMLCITCLAILWLFNLLIEKRRLSYKLGIIVSIFFVVGIVVANNLFSDQINLYLMRFGQVNVADASSLTTGRSRLWMVYLNYLFSNTDKMLFGIGLSQDQVRILLKTNNAHFSLIEIVYQLGITGGLLMLWWWKGVYQQLVDKKKQMHFSQRVYFLIMLGSVFLPWLALDMVYTKEFFYFVLLIFLSINYLLENNQNPIEMINNE